MPSSQSSGSQTCVISTEHTLATITTAGDYRLTLDLNALADGDVFIVREKLKVGSGGTTRQFAEWSVGPVVSPDKVFRTPKSEVVNEVVYTITQTAGTGRVVPWEVINCAGSVTLGTGAITSATFAAGAIDAAAIAADAIGSSELAASAVTEIQSGLAAAADLATLATAVDALPTNAELATAIDPLPTAAELATALVPIATAAEVAAAVAPLATSAEVGAVPTVDEIWAKAMSELTAVPGVTGTVLQALTHVFMEHRNAIAQTSSVRTTYQDDGSTVYATRAVADNGTVLTVGEETTA